MEQRRAQKRPRDAGDSDNEQVENDDETAPTRSKAQDAHSDLDNHTSAMPEGVGATLNPNDGAEQTKKRRKRRKKGPATTLEASHGSDVDEEL